MPETRITSSDDFQPAKAVLYRMHPGNVACLTAARLDVCALANNHVLDFGVGGLEETLDVLTRARLGPVRDAMSSRHGAQLRSPPVHWGSNWGHDVPRAQVRFAHRLIDSGVDVVHGHSSHHPRPVEVYRGRLVLYRSPSSAAIALPQRVPRECEG